MASSYLDLYGNYEKRVPTRGGKTWTSPVDQASRVVHDKLNNVYYGIHSQADTVKYLTQAIARSQQIANSTHGTRRVRKGRGYRDERYAYSAAERQQHQQTLANQNSYLKNINNGNYRQSPHGNQFFDSYDAYTQDYNNIYQRNYNNNVQAERNAKIKADNARRQKEHQAALERNRLQAIENDKIAVRNQKIEGEQEASEQNKNQLAINKNKSRAKPLKPNLTIGTGLAGGAFRGLSNTGLSL